MPPKSKITDDIRSRSVPCLEKVLHLGKAQDRTFRFGESYTLPISGNLFDELLASVRFEDVGKGRQGAVLIKIDDICNIPIVRTTTRYSAPAQRFQSVHDRLARQIQTIASLAVGFNNALIENLYERLHHNGQSFRPSPGSGRRVVDRDFLLLQISRSSKPAKEATRRIEGA